MLPVSGDPLPGTGAAGGFRITGRHVLAAMLVFFGIVIGVNVTFVHLALSSWTGLTDHQSYRSGISWNRTLERDAAQKALGWTAAVDSRFSGDAVAGGRPFEVTVTIRDRDGHPVTGLAFAGEARHPVLEIDDRSLTFAEAGGGVYRGTAVLPSAADWELMLVATRPDGFEYRIETVAAVR
ncbi:nitrogen fixation protein FixH [Thalassobaculum fulvum]|jgi:nitrogen fixation protein FixH|uniref:Nitrogen fixation protein FixH n=2 Tax=Thalassobaculum fulvum TaxID=1633335 RepID=A0A918XUL8_9PROT|nr:nitrogen fixation protein FixH [Thalassobaculum fulvum]